MLTPRLAVVWAAFFNFVAFLVFGTHVASTIANDVVDQSVLSIGLIFAGLVGAIVWSLFTFFLGLPTSSSHALIGGMVGAAVAKAGFGVLVWDGLRTIAVFIVLAPLAGLALVVRPHGRSCCGACTGTTRSNASTGAFGTGSSSRPARTASDTAPTTRRRRWA